MRQFIMFSLFILSSIPSLSLAQDTITVPMDYISIQGALEAANEGTIILVAPGTYYENLQWPRTNGIQLIGELGSDVTTIDGQGIGRVINTPITNDLTDITIIGFQIENGYIESGFGAGLNGQFLFATLGDLVFQNNIIDGDGEGGAVFLYNVNATIKDCGFLNNEINGNQNRAKGAGLNITSFGQSIITNCEFINNNATSGGWTFGGGLYGDGGSLLISNCTFKENKVSSDSWPYGGGAYFNSFGVPVIEINSTEFIGNISEGTGFSLKSAHGGGMHSGAKMEVTDCIFQGNKANDGAAVYLDDSFSNNYITPTSASFNNCKFTEHIMYTESLQIESLLEIYRYENVDFQNCIIDNNRGTSIYSRGYLYAQSMINLNHCTIVNNADAIKIDRQILNATNSIFYNNSEEQFIQLFSGEADSVFLFENCLIDGGYAGINIIDTDPLFVSEDVLIPTPDSPCINMGIDLGINQDFNGSPRPQPVNSLPDIGAYEIDQTFSSTSAIANNHKHIIFPNPASDEIRLLKQAEVVRIYNEDGLEIIHAKMTDRIDVSHLVDGVYFVMLEINGLVWNEKLVVVK